MRRIGAMACVSVSAFFAACHSEGPNEVRRWGSQSAAVSQVQPVSVTSADLEGGLEFITEA